MRILNLAILVSFLCLCSCTWEAIEPDEAIAPVKEIITEAELIGNWEAYEETNLQTGVTFVKEPQHMLGYYCSAFELRDNNEFSIYYHYVGTVKPPSQSASGIWRFEENKKLIFEFSLNTINAEIIELTEDHLIIESVKVNTPT